MADKVTAASIEDKEWLEHLRRDVYQELFKATFGGWNEVRHTRQFSECWDRGCISIINVDGVRVGMIQLFEQPDAVEVAEIQIERRHQSKGIGSRVLNDVIARAHRQGKKVVLSVGLKNYRAFELYQRLGFRKVSQSETHHHMVMTRMIIREASPSDETFLREMLYHSLYVPEGSAPFDLGVLRHPEIAKYVDGWGRPGDLGVIAKDSESDGNIGAAWMRLFSGSAKGYGFVADDIPELAMAVLPGYRGCGVGTALLKRLLEDARKYEAVSLSVSIDNPARRLYERFGFEPVGTSGSSLTMLKRCRSHYTET